MRFYPVILILLMGISPCRAENTSAAGIELDAVPWLTGGHYLSGWYGKDHFRYRAVASKINVPDSFAKQGFKDWQITAYALIMDYFPRREQTGIWYGGGFEYWQSKIANQADNISAEYHNTVFTVGLGYVWPLTDSLYLNPWAALHRVIGGDENISVGNQTYRQDRTEASASVKLGWRF